MRKVTFTIAAGDLDDMLDRLLPLVPQGVHDLPLGDDRIELFVYGDAPSRAELEARTGLRATESEADDDPERRRLAAYARREPIAGRLVVRPAAAPPPAGDGLLDVVIESPGGVFGAGTHPTTAMCLELLLGLEPAGAFADLGCGTGVLAIVAARLGYSPVIALDHEESAVEAARANARRNAAALDARRADLLEIPPPPVHVLAANVPPKVHARLAERLAPQTGAVIASGVVEDLLPDVLAAYERAGLTPASRLQRRGWTATLLIRDA